MVQSNERDFCGGVTMDQDCCNAGPTFSALALNLRYEKRKMNEIC